MLKLIIWFYLMFYAQLVLHELGHALVALAGRIRISNIRIGSQNVSARFGCVELSPIPLGGEVEVQAADFNEKSRFYVIGFFEGGAAMNLLSSILCFQFGRESYGLLFVLAGFAIAVTSNLVFLPGSDAYECLAYLRKEKR